jgi:hypothetical protein
MYSIYPGSGHGTTVFLESSISSAQSQSISPFKMAIGCMQWSERKKLPVCSAEDSPCIHVVSDRHTVQLSINAQSGSASRALPLIAAMSGAIRHCPE